MALLLYINFPGLSSVHPCGVQLCSESVQCSHPVPRWLCCQGVLDWEQWLFLWCWWWGSIDQDWWHLSRGHQLFANILLDSGLCVCMCVCVFPLTEYLCMFLITKYLFMYILSMNLCMFLVTKYLCVFLVTANTCACSYHYILVYKVPVLDSVDQVPVYVLNQYGTCVPSILVYTWLLRVPVYVPVDWLPVYVHTDQSTCVCFCSLQVQTCTFLLMMVTHHYTWLLEPQVRNSER